MTCSPQSINSLSPFLLNKLISEVWEEHDFGKTVSDIVGLILTHKEMELSDLIPHFVFLLRDRFSLTFKCCIHSVYSE